eukprot:gene9828-2150_t
MGGSESKPKEDFETYTKDEFDQLQVMQVKNLDTKQVSNLLDFEAEFYKQKVEEKQKENEEFQIMLYNGQETQKLIKNMKVLTNEFSTLERYQYKELIYEKIENSFKFLMEKIDKSNLKSTEILKETKFFNQENYFQFIDFFHEFEVQKIYLKYYEQVITLENLEYFIENLNRISSYNYLPSNEDILKCYDPYFKEMIINLNGMIINFLDASEFTYKKVKNMKRKTSNIDRIHFNYIIFIVDLTDYLKNDENNINFMTTKMIHLTNLMALFPYFSILILYVNIIEFKSSISSVNINTCPEFKEYNGNQNFKSSFAFIKKKFNQISSVSSMKSDEFDDFNELSILNSVKEICSAIVMREVLSNDNIY